MRDGARAHAGIASLFSHQAEAWRSVMTRRATRSSPPAPRAASRSASTCPCCTCCPATRARGRSTSTRQGARPGPGAAAVGAANAGAAPRDLRRRHAHGGAHGDPAALEPGAHQPRHAARRHPAPPRQLGRLPGQPGARGRGRGAHLSRRVRLARRRTCCAGCAGSRAPTGRSRASCSRRRRSPTRSRAGREPDRPRLPAHRSRRRAAQRPPRS